MCIGVICESIEYIVDCVICMECNLDINTLEKFVIFLTIGL